MEDHGILHSKGMVSVTRLFLGELEAMLKELLKQLKIEQEFLIIISQAKGGK